MASLTLSVMNYGAQTESVLTPLIREFEEQSRIRVKLQIIDWEDGRNVLNRMVFQGQGADVSEIGQTWLTDFILMNVVQPLTNRELSEIGKAEDFVPVSWVNCTLPGNSTVWAIPWLTDVFAIHYHKDLLQQAGVDEATAFQSFAAIDQTVERLKQIGVEIPVHLPLNQDRFTNLHCLAPWVWGMGGDFGTPDGKRMLIDQPEFIAAVVAYYRLLRHLSPQALTFCRENHYIDAYHAKQSAIMFGSRGVDSPASIRPTWGVAPFPNASFTGGSNLVIWKHCRQRWAALELVSFLLGSPFQARFAIPLGVLPCRVESFSLPPFRNQPWLQSLAKVLLNARTYQTFPIWGLVEDRLSQVLLDIWDAYYADPGIDLQATAQKHLFSLATRLNITLSQYRPPNL